MKPEDLIAKRLLPIENCTECIYFLENTHMLGCLKSGHSIIYNQYKVGTGELFRRGVKDLMKKCPLEEVKENEICTY